MQALLEAIGDLGKLGAEALTAAEERRAAILSEADAAWRSYRESMVGFFAGLAADDADMAALAKPAAAPAQPTPPIIAPALPAATTPQPTGEG